MKIIRSENIVETSRRLAAFICESISEKLKHRPYFNFVLSGGSTPKTLYQILATEYKEKIQLEKVNVFWGDERFVPADDERSNYRMAEEALLCKIAIPPSQVHAIPTNISPQNSAESYSRLLKGYISSGSPLDLVLLGMGADGHTLSLFSGSREKLDFAKWVEVTRNDDDNTDRITLMPSLVNAADCLVFLVTGQDKAGRLAEVIESHTEPLLPAAMIKPIDGQLYWFIDEDAAALLKDRNLKS